MTEVKKVTIQIKAPRGKFPGEVAIGYYCVVEGSVVLTDENGKPVGDKHYLGPNDDAHLIACRMVRQRRSRSTGPGGFNRPLNYPKLVY